MTNLKWEHVTLIGIGAYAFLKNKEMNMAKPILDRCVRFMDKSEKYIDEMMEFTKEDEA